MLCQHKPDWRGFRFLRDAVDTGDNLYVGFDYEFCDEDNVSEGDGRHLWVYAGDFGDPDSVAHLVRKFLHTFRPGEHWSLTYASYCSSPRVGEFDGGALFVTAEKVRWKTASAFVDKRVALFEQDQHVCRLVQLVEDLGLAAEQLDDAVHENAASEAATVNNGGIECQVEYLVGAHGAAETERMLRAAVGNRTGDRR